MNNVLATEARKYLRKVQIHRTGEPVLEGYFHEFFVELYYDEGVQQSRLLAVIEETDGSVIYADPQKVSFVQDF